MANLRRKTPKVRRGLTASDISGLLTKHDIRLKKSLGQHMLANPRIAEQMVELADISPQDKVLEIGPGLGTLTLGLAAAGAEVVAVETDTNLKEPLLESLGELVGATTPAGVSPSTDATPTDATPLGDTPAGVAPIGATPLVRLIWEDACRIDWTSFLENMAWCENLETNQQSNQKSGWKLVANLPYNIATKLVLDILQKAPEVRELTVMVQLEVAERLTSPPGKSTRGIPSVKVEYWGEAKLLRRIPAGVFRPPPKVESAIVQILRCPQPPVAPQIMFPLLEKAFGQRRKMLRNSLKDTIPREAFVTCGVREDARPEELKLSEWVALANCQHG